MVELVLWGGARRGRDWMEKAFVKQETARILNPHHSLPNWRMPACDAFGKAKLFIWMLFNVKKKTQIIIKNHKRTSTLRRVKLPSPLPCPAPRPQSFYCAVHNHLRSSLISAVQLKQKGFRFTSLILFRLETMVCICRRAQSHGSLSSQAEKDLPFSNIVFSHGHSGLKL